MSSLSFDNVFPPNPEDSSGRPSSFTTARALRRVSAWNAPLPPVAFRERTVSDASPWAISRRRRIIELGVAAAALVILMPLMAIVAALIWLDSGGPVLFRQKRMGGHGREFTLCKFRSMRVERDCRSCVTVSGDARITRVGAFLRRYKLDELPQFWNVLRGDMGLVGPRPKLPHLEPLHMTYRPGITGAATLAFRNEEEFLAGIPEVEVEAFYEMFVKPAKAQLDFDYMRRATFLSDMALLRQTLTSCVCSPPQSVALAADVVARYAAEWNGARVS